MKRIRIMGLALIAGLLLAATGLQAQYYSSGQDPASIRWKQLNSDHFKIIFPQGYEVTAQYVMNLMEYARSIDTITLHSDPKKIPIILHNRTAVSNAQSLWAPKRMDFYHIPPQDTYPQEWFQQLALHEYRHTVQLTKINQGLTRVLSWLFGEQATAAVLGLYVPFWFIEGDAVAAETELSLTGRGRSPSFAMPLRAQFLGKEIYSLDKAFFDSYRDFTPNHYILGYHIVGKAREHYGTEIWDHAVDKVAKNPYMVVPFSEGIRDVSGFSKTGLYQEMMKELKNDWKTQLVNTPIFPVDSIPQPEKRIFTSYGRPHLTKQGTIIAEKKEMDDIARFVEIDREGNEKVIFTPGFYYPGSLTVAGGKMAWSERAYDPRWSNRSYAVIKMYNMESGNLKTLTHKTRYFAPSFSPDASMLVVSEVTQDQQYRLVIIDARSGKIIRTFDTRENYFLRQPSWSADGGQIVAAGLGDSGNTILSFDVETGASEQLIDFTWEDIFRPLVYENRLIFVGSWSGIDNLYVMDLASGRISQVSSVEYGLNDPQVIQNGDQILFANYTPDGFEISTMSLLADNWIPLDRVEDRSIRMPEVLAAQADTILDPGSVPDSMYQERKYSRLTHLFNIHSWGPISIDANNYDVKPGVTLASQNALSTSFLTMGWEYDLNEENGKYFINYSYEGWYPALDFRADYGRRESFTFDTLENRIDFSWMETNFSTTVRLPLNLTTNKYSRFLQPSVQFEYVQLDMDEDAEVRFKRSNYKSVNYRLYLSNLLKRTEHDLNPRWGQVLDLNLQTAPFNNDTLGSMFAAETRLFFPGLFRHHSFNVYGGYQKRFGSNLFFGSIVNYPRGFHHLRTNELVSYSFNYKFPFWYPDVSLSSLAYIKRLKANFFYDRADGRHAGHRLNWHSTGVEVFADMHILRLLPLFELGYRLTYRPDYSDLTHEFLFSINLFTF